MKGKKISNEIWLAEELLFFTKKSDSHSSSAIIWIDKCYTTTINKRVGGCSVFFIVRLLAVSMLYHTDIQKVDL